MVERLWRSKLSSKQPQRSPRDAAQGRRPEGCIKTTKGWIISNEPQGWGVILVAWEHILTLPMSEMPFHHFTVTELHHSMHWSMRMMWHSSFSALFFGRQPSSSGLFFEITYKLWTCGVIEKEGQKFGQPSRRPLHSCSLRDIVANEQWVNIQEIPTVWIVQGMNIKGNLYRTSGPRK